MDGHPDTSRMAALEKRVEALQDRQTDLYDTVETLQDQRRTLLSALSEQTGMSRRQVLALFGVAGGGGALSYLGAERAAAAGETWGSDSGTVGTDAEPIANANIDVLDAGTVTADDATFGTLNGSFGIRLKQADTPELHRAVTVAVSGNSYHSIYDKASGVDCLGGVVIGKSINSLRITWGDDTTTTISDGDDSPIRGDDGDGTAFSTLPVPALQDAKKVEFRNDDGNPADYGYWVLTV